MTSPVRRKNAALLALAAIAALLFSTLLLGTTPASAATISVGSFDVFVQDRASDMANSEPTDDAIVQVTVHADSPDDPQTPNTTTTCDHDWSSTGYFVCPFYPADSSDTSDNTITIEAKPSSLAGGDWTSLDPVNAATDLGYATDGEPRIEAGHNFGVYLDARPATVDVEDASGHPIIGASGELFADPDANCANTDSLGVLDGDEGTIDVGELPIGTAYCLSVGAPGYVSTTLSLPAGDSANAHTVELAESGDTSTVTITGTAYQLTDPDDWAGVEMSGGGVVTHAAMPDVAHQPVTDDGAFTLTVAPVGHPDNAVACSLTDHNTGAFSCVGVPYTPGIRNGYIYKTRTGVIETNVPIVRDDAYLDGDTYDFGDLIVPPQTTVAGTVTDSDDQPLANATVRLYARFVDAQGIQQDQADYQCLDAYRYGTLGSPLAVATTDAAGAFDLGRVEVDSGYQLAYCAVARAPGLMPRVEAIVATDANTTALHPVFDLIQAPATMDFWGYVSVSRDSSDAPTSNSTDYDNSLAAAVVTVTSDHGLNVSCGRSEDDGGYYDCYDVPFDGTATYTLTATWPGRAAPLATQTIGPDDFTYDDLDDAQTEVSLTAYDLAYGTISGSANDTSNDYRSIEGTVELLQGCQVVETQEVYGYFDFGNVPAGQYGVRIIPDDGYLPHTVLMSDGGDPTYVSGTTRDAEIDLADGADASVEFLYGQAPDLGGATEASESTLTDCPWTAPVTGQAVFAGGSGLEGATVAVAPGDQPAPADFRSCGRVGEDTWILDNDSDYGLTGPFTCPAITYDPADPVFTVRLAWPGYTLDDVLVSDAWVDEDGSLDLGTVFATADDAELPSGWLTLSPSALGDEEGTLLEGATVTLEDVATTNGVTTADTVERTRTLDDGYVYDDDQVGVVASYDDPEFDYLPLSAAGHRYVVRVTPVGNAPERCYDVQFDAESSAEVFPTYGQADDSIPCPVVATTPPSDGPPTSPAPTTTTGTVHGLLRAPASSLGSTLGLAGATVRISPASDPTLTTTTQVTGSGGAFTAALVYDTGQPASVYDVVVTLPDGHGNTTTLFTGSFTADAAFFGQQYVISIPATFTYGTVEGYVYDRNHHGVGAASVDLCPDDGTHGYTCSVPVLTTSTTGSGHYRFDVVPVGVPVVPLAVARPVPRIMALTQVHPLSLTDGAYVVRASYIPSGSSTPQTVVQPVAVAPAQAASAPDATLPVVVSTPAPPPVTTSPTPTHSPTPTPTPTQSPTPTHSPTPTTSPTRSTSPTPTVTPTHSSSPTVSPTQPATTSAAPTGTATETAVPPATSDSQTTPPSAPQTTDSQPAPVVPPASQPAPTSEETTAADALGGDVSPQAQAVLAALPPEALDEVPGVVSTETLTELVIGAADSDLSPAEITQLVEAAHSSDKAVARDALQQLYTKGNPPRHLNSPSAFTHATATVAEIIQHPKELAVAAGTGVVWMLPLVLILQLVDESLGEFYRAASGRMARLLPALSRGAGRLGAWLSNGSANAIGIYLIGTALISSFVDPHVGLNAATLRLVASMAMSALVTTVAVQMIVGYVLRRTLGYETKFHASPFGLVVTLIGVLISRFMAFTPGLILGSNLDLESDEDAPETIQINVERLRAFVVLALAGLAWIASSFMPADGNLVMMFLRDACVAITTASLGSLLIEMLPLPLMPGGLLAKKATKSWIVIAGITAAGFMVVLLPHATGTISGGSKGTWMTIAGVIAACAVTLVVAGNVRHHRASKRETSEALDPR